MSRSRSLESGFAAAAERDSDTSFSSPSSSATGNLAGRWHAVLQSNSAPPSPVHTKTKKLSPEKLAPFIPSVSSTSLSLSATKQMPNLVAPSPQTPPASAEQDSSYQEVETYRDVGAVGESDEHKFPSASESGPLGSFNTTSKADNLQTTKSGSQTTPAHLIQTPITGEHTASVESPSPQHHTIESETSPPKDVALGVENPSEKTTHPQALTSSSIPTSECRSEFIPVADALSTAEAEILARGEEAEKAYEPREGTEQSRHVFDKEQRDGRGEETSGSQIETLETVGYVGQRAVGAESGETEKGGDEVGYVRQEENPQPAHEDYIPNFSDSTPHPPTEEEQPNQPDGQDRTASTDTTTTTQAPPRNQIHPGRSTAMASQIMHATIDEAKEELLAESAGEAKVDGGDEFGGERGLEQPVPQEEPQRGEEQTARAEELPAQADPHPSNSDKERDEAAHKIQGAFHKHLDRREGPAATAEEGQPAQQAEKQPQQAEEQSAQEQPNEEPSPQPAESDKERDEAARKIQSCYRQFLIHKIAMTSRDIIYLLGITRAHLQIKKFLVRTEMSGIDADDFNKVKFVDAYITHMLQHLENGCISLDDVNGKLLLLLRQRLLRGKPHLRIDMSNIPATLQKLIEFKNEVLTANMVLDELGRRVIGETEGGAMRWMGHAEELEEQLQDAQLEVELLTVEKDRLEATLRRACFERGRWWEFGASLVDVVMRKPKLSMCELFLAARRIATFGRSAWMDISQMIGEPIDADLDLMETTQLASPKRVKSADSPTPEKANPTAEDHFDLTMEAEDLAKLRRPNRLSGVEVAAVKFRKSEFLSQIGRDNEEFKQLDETRRMLIKEVDSLGVSVEELKQQNSEHVKVRHNLELQVADLMSRAESTAKGQSDLQKVKAESNAALRNLQMRLEEEERTRRNFEELSQRHEKKVNAYQTEIDRLESQLGDLGSDLRREKKRRKRLEGKLRRVKDRCEKLGAELGGEKGRAEKLGAELKEEKGNVKRSRMQLKEERKMVEWLRMEYSRQKSRTEKLGSDLKDEKAKVQDRNAELKAAKSKMETLVADVAEANGKIEKITAALSVGPAGVFRWVGGLVGGVVEGFGGTRLRAAAQAGWTSTF
ncbi:hypothetical protein HK097_002909 [Rhizophlyctis rosea]|uniref:Uncharacterized protein n=1 Tax=Rhizophlyctis rosea TaxID=64517 RepID=A0AAD5SML4_9FUNG|nr:hypothetical protein HK097_002909 [Rhizophlyctis rosea]